MSLEPLETAEASDYPMCRQLSVFLENRLGQLLRLTRLFEQQAIHILGLSVEGSVDCSIVRLLVDDPDGAVQLLAQTNFAVAETELLVVELPPGKRGLMTVCSALIAAEVNINYLYPLIASEERGACLAIQVDNPSQAVGVLAAGRFHVLDQGEL